MKICSIENNLFYSLIILLKIINELGTCSQFLFGTIYKIIFLSSKSLVKSLYINGVSRSELKSYITVCEFSILTN